MIVLLSLVAIYWLILSLFSFYHVRNIFRFFKDRPIIQIKQQWRGFIHDNYQKWDEKKILIGCFTRFPFNLTILGLILIGFVTLIPLSKYFGKRGRQIVIKIQKTYGNFAIRQAFNIVEDLDYKTFKVQTPIVISNHINWFDSWYFCVTLMPLSYVAKAVIKKTPIVGVIGDFFQTIYVDRQNQSQRDGVIQKITERVKDFNKNKDKSNQQRTPPLIIFPQGTTSNGKNIITFKNGAFNDLAPITMFGLSYKCKQFHMGMGDMTQTQHTFINLCLKPTLQVKHKVIRPKDGQSVDDYSKRCRQQMGKLTGFPLVQCRYRDLLQYEQCKKRAWQQKISKKQVTTNKKE